jgi:Cell wall-active antibiotics response 4TMS YvqF
MSSEPPEERREEQIEERPPPPHPRPSVLESVPLGRLVLGGILLLGGGLWLLSSLDVIDISLTAVLPVALVVVGLALVIGSRTGRHSGLIVAGAILTVMLVFASSFDIRLEGGVGQRDHSPTSIANLEREYRLAMGEMTIDLTTLEFSPGTTRVDASVGMGELRVRVPDNIVVQAHATAGAGQVVLFGEESNGIDAELSKEQSPIGPAPPGGLPILVLELSVGLGQVDVDG